MHEAGGTTEAAPTPTVRSLSLYTEHKSSSLPSQGWSIMGITPHPQHCTTLPTLCTYTLCIYSCALCSVRGSGV